MKHYFTAINSTQNAMLTISVALLLVLPSTLTFWPHLIAPHTQLLYALAHYSLLFVMSVRPLADIFTGVKWIRPLVILRKGFGVFSASIIMSFIFSKIIVDPSGFVASFFSFRYWSLEGYALFAHAADVSAFLLLITSNKLSKQVLNKWWKRVQRLSYVYFFGSSLYLFLVFGDQLMLVFMIFVAGITLWAFSNNRKRRLATANV